MRVCCNPAMSGKVFAHCGHAGLLHASHESAAQLDNLLRLLTKSAMTNHRVVAVIQIQYRSKAEVDTDGEHLLCHQPAGQPGVFLRVITIGYCVHRRQSGEAATQALHPPSFLVNRNQHVGTYLPNAAG